MGDPKIKCFNHPKSPGVTVCNQCQRPICEKCAIEIWERVLCLGCAAVMYSEHHPEEAEPTLPPIRVPAMGRAGIAFFYVLWTLCLWGGGALAFRLLGSPGSRINEFYLALSGITLVLVGGLAFWQNGTRGFCRECATVNNLHDFRRQASWAEFWQPPAICRTCGCAFGPGELHLRKSKGLEKRSFLS
jgi:hypothetical protein